MTDAADHHYKGMLDERASVVEFLRTFARRAHAADVKSLALAIENGEHRETFELRPAPPESVGGR